MLTIRKQETFALDPERPSYLTAAIFTCQDKRPFGILGYKLLDLLTPKRKHYQAILEKRHWYQRNLDEKELFTLPSEIDKHILLWDRLEERNRGIGVWIYTPKEKRTRWMCLDVKIDARFVTPIQFLAPSVIKNFEL